MNRRKFLLGVAAAAVAAPVVVEALQRPEVVRIPEDLPGGSAWYPEAAIARSLKSEADYWEEVGRRQIEALRKSMAQTVRESHSKYFASKDAWYLLDYPRGIKLVPRAQLVEEASAILDRSFTEVYGSSGL